ncbi:predicted protein [Scheffersomyces stipitis CBS 6054]|uniref:CUE domain-containing protein n=1 Tax=Scheffersomyces stipitis (strain ATCC 58785 / CBS 6054 / NBRC 10063 / NRRL Y-11545) TaxID=322104 RepID=A3LVB3_PICST|nr:predicted protein [Scheffersomyces stipitis CBS 6054]ABN66749.2 predicted protein [Scheffersomyces stipitis CBS 6054]
MDSSTVIFVATLAIAFIFLRWLIAPIPQSNEFNIAEAAGNTSTGQESNNSSNASNTGNARSRRRPVTDSMVEVVQTIAPGLTRDQIVFDLSNTGSVELTINRYMELGNLPYPPNSARGTNSASSNEIHSQSQSQASSRSATEATMESNSSPKEDLAVGDSTSSSWEADKSERSVSLHRRKQEMIVAARRRLEASLKNELDLSQ